MKKLLVMAACLVWADCSFGQEAASDILYVKTKNIDKSYAGKFAHLDFNKNGAAGDTVLLTVNNAPVQFVGRRAGNGQGGRFYGQYLESAGYINGYTVRLVKSRIDAVGSDYIQLTNYFDFYSRNNALAAGKSVQEEYRVNKNMVNQVLVKVDKSDM